MLITQLNINARAKSFLLRVLDEHDPKLPKELEVVAPLVDPSMFKEAKNLGRVSEKELKALLAPFWEEKKKSVLSAKKNQLRIVGQTGISEIVSDLIPSGDPVDPNQTVIPLPDFQEMSQQTVAPLDQPPPLDNIIVSYEEPSSIVAEPHVQTALSTWTSPAESFKTHPIMRASALNGLHVCPKRLQYMQYQKSLEEETDNPYTTIGRMGHQYIASMLLTSGNERNALKAFDRTRIGDLTIEQMREFWRYLSTGDRLPVSDTAKVFPGCRIIVESPSRMTIGGIEVTGTVDYAFVNFAEKYGMVCDWKFYHVPEELPRIEEDYQMLTYALQLRNAYNLTDVTLRRFLGYQLEYDEIHLGPVEISIGIEALGEIVDTVWRKQNEANLGHQCHSCFQSPICTTYQRHMETSAATTPLAQFDVHQFAFQKDEDVRDFIISAKTIEGIIKNGMEAAKLYAQRTNRPIFDPVSQREWGPVTSGRARIVDVKKAASLLKTYIGDANIWEMLDLSKGVIEQKLTASGLDKDQRRAFFRTLRNIGALEYTDVEKYEWHRVQIDTEKTQRYSAEINRDLTAIEMVRPSSDKRPRP